MPKRRLIATLVAALEPPSTMQIQIKSIALGLLQAQALLVATGAARGVDSVLHDFRGRQVFGVFSTNSKSRE